MMKTRVVTIELQASEIDKKVDVANCHITTDEYYDENKCPHSKIIVSFFHRQFSECLVSVILALSRGWVSRG